MWLFLRLSEFPMKLSKTHASQLVCGLYCDVERVAASDAFRNEIEVNSCERIQGNTPEIFWKI